MESNNYFIRFKIFYIIFIMFVLSLPKPTLAQRAVIKLDGVNIYSLPMVQRTPLATLSKGDIVRVIGQRGTWVKIEFNDRQKGWMLLQVRKNKDTPNGKARKTKKRNREQKRTNTHDSNGVGLGKNNISKTRDPYKITKQRKESPVNAEQLYRRFGYSFGMGILESDFTYNWKFVFHSTPRLALVGSFKHALGSTADSYFIIANLSYLLKENAKMLPFITGGLGVINTVPARGIGIDSVSNMAINYGFGFRKYLRRNMALIFSLTQYTVFVGKGYQHSQDFTIGLLVGNFWN